MRMKSNLAGRTIGLAVLMIALIGSTVRATTRTTQSFNAFPGFGVEFTNCVESIGVTLVPTTSARAYVPNQFVLAGDGQPVTPLVARTARCAGLIVDGHSSGGVEIVQIGAVLVPPDFTGDINNYSIWYYTTNLRLALRLLLAGINAQYVPTIDYDHNTQDNTLRVRVPLPGIPRLEISGAVIPSPQPAGSFVANWWQATMGGSLKMSTSVPVINIGTADLLMTTNQHGPLGQLIGGPSIGFPIIQQFNTFSAAHMEVRVAP